MNVVGTLWNPALRADVWKPSPMCWVCGKIARAITLKNDLEQQSPLLSIRCQCGWEDVLPTVPIADSSFDRISIRREVAQGYRPYFSFTRRRIGAMVHVWSVPLAPGGQRYNGDGWVRLEANFGIVSDPIPIKFPLRIKMIHTFRIYGLLREEEQQPELTAIFELDGKIVGQRSELLPPPT